MESIKNVLDYAWGAINGSSDALVNYAVGFGHSSLSLLQQLYQSIIP